MKSRIIQCRTLPAFAFAALLACFSITQNADAQTHGIGTTTAARGPSGQEKAHVGDTVTVSATVRNLDDFNHAQRITNIVLNLITPPRLTTGNLIPSLGGVFTLTNFLDFRSFTSIATYVVLPTDPSVIVHQVESDSHDLGNNLLQESDPRGNLTVLRPCISITKVCDYPPGASCFPYGAAIRYRGQVCNTGDTPLTGITVIDTPAGPIVPGSDVRSFAATTSSGRPFDGTLNTNECINYSGSYQPLNQGGTSLCGPFDDTVVATGTDELGLTVRNTDPCPPGGPPRPPVTARCLVCTNPNIDVTKECLDPVVPAGTPARYRVRVQNIGDVPLVNVTMVDNSATPGNAADDITIPVGTLTNGAFSAWFTNSVPTSEADCAINGGSRTNTVVATGANICNPAQTVNDTARCDFLVTCTPCIRIFEEVVCVRPDTLCVDFGSNLEDQTTACGFTNKNSTDCSAFCFKITIQAVCIDGRPSQVPVTGIVVTSKLDISGCGFPTSLPPGGSYSCILPRVTLCTNFTDIVTVVATGVPPDADDTDSVSVILKPIAVRCDSTLTSSLDMDQLPNCVELPDGTIAAPLTLTTTITNESDVALDVTVANLPALVNCGDQVTPVPVPSVIPIPAHGTYVITGCVISDCTNTEYRITVSGAISTNLPSGDCACIYNSNGQPIRTSADQNDICPVCIKCTPAVTCRVTGGGVLIPGFSDQSCIEVNTTIYPFTSPNGLTIKKITHGGQLGAPFSQMDCGAVLGNPCIRGQWSHIRHYEGTANPRDVIDMDFHSTTPKGVYDSLFCACLGCCDPETGVFIPPVLGPLVHKFQICNPDDHKICGPMPRPAPANVIIWSGVGKVTPTDDIGGSRAAQQEWVIFRIYIEDRSEPGGGHPGGAVNPADIYCFQAWKTGIKTSKKPDFNTISTAFRTALGQANCDFVNALESGALPIGSLPSPTVNGLTADIQDCGPMHDGNHQIHPATGATCNE